MNVLTIITAVLVAVGHVAAIDTNSLRGGDDYAASFHSASEEIKAARDGCYTNDDTPTPSVLSTPAPSTPSVDYPTSAPSSIVPNPSSATPVMPSAYPTPVQTSTPASDSPSSAPIPSVTAPTSDYEVPSPPPATPPPTPPPAPVTPVPATPQPTPPPAPVPATPPTTPPPAPMTPAPPVTPQPTPPSAPVTPAPPVTPQPTPSRVTPVPSPSPSFDPDQSYQRPNECLGSISATLKKQENCNLEFMVNSQGLKLYGCMRCNETFTADILTAPYYMCGSKPICSRFYQYFGVTPNNLKCLVLAKGNKDPSKCGLW
jgi:hypothetical protein